VKVEWQDLMRDFAAMRAIEFEHEDQRCLLRTDVRGSANCAFPTVDSRPPPRAQPFERATDV
jgi:hypothetical protein